MATLQELLKAPGRISEIAVTGHDYRDVDGLAQRLSVAVPEAEVLPWYELDRFLGSMVDVMDGFVLVWMVVVFATLGFGLVNTLAMAVFERAREIGMMQALGMRPTTILYQVLLESLLLLAIGLALGDIAAVVTISPLESGIDVSVVAEGMEMMGAGSVLYPSLSLRDLLLADVIVIVLGLVACAIPAWRASRYDPVVAMTTV